jgi:tetrahydromethanopterin S-methyltransferase subunit F
MSDKRYQDLSIEELKIFWAGIIVGVVFAVLLILIINE